MTHDFVRCDYGRPVDVAYVPEHNEDNLISRYTTHAHLFLYHKFPQQWALALHYMGDSANGLGDIPGGARQKDDEDWAETPREAALRQTREQLDAALSDLGTDDLCYIGKAIVREVDDRYSESYTAFYAATLPDIDPHPYRQHEHTVTSGAIFMSTPEMNVHPVITSHRTIFQNAKLFIYEGHL